MGLFSFFCSFSKRLIFNCEFCTNPSTAWFTGCLGLAAWVTSLRLWLSICKASKWASLYTSTNFSPVSGLQVHGLPGAAARVCSGTWPLKSKLAAMHLSLCPTGPKKTSSSSFALCLKKRLSVGSYTGIQMKGFNGKGRKLLFLFTLKKTRKDRSQIFHLPKEESLRGGGKSPLLF